MFSGGEGVVFWGLPQGLGVVLQLPASVGEVVALTLQLFAFLLVLGGLPL